MRTERAHVLAFLRLIVLLCACGCARAALPERAPLDATLRLTHVAADTWRAEYRFAEPVLAVDLAAAAGGYRASAWRLDDPHLTLAAADGRETIDGHGKSFSTLALTVTRWALPIAKSYIPFDRFSDGGTVMFLGYFDGTAQQPAGRRKLRLTVRLAGLPGETVIAPEPTRASGLAYAYFGPAVAVGAGRARLIVDPLTPPELARVLTSTITTLSQYYEGALHRKLGYVPLVMLSIADTTQDGVSSKGGAIGTQIVLRLAGRGLLQPSAALNNRLTWLVAHELAHLWQLSAAHGGIGEGDEWIHEGGAEALALAALERSGLLAPAQAQAFASGLLEECSALHGNIEAVRGMYACGYQRHVNSGIDVFALWRALIEQSEARDEVYSSAMFLRVLRELAGTVPSR
jgi:hypothetical protein